MLFTELKLCMAIHRAQLGGSDITSHAKRLDMVRDVVSVYIGIFEDCNFPYSIDDVDRWRLNLRKNTGTRIKVEVALEHGSRCYFDGRGKGPCCSEVECGHIVQNCMGGELSVANCQIECRSHNNQRLSMSIEDYLKSPLTTDSRRQLAV
jgi:hypothetical protein